jgi:hypothetical protein
MHRGVSDVPEHPWVAFVAVTPSVGASLISLDIGADRCRLSPAHGYNDHYQQSSPARRV